MGRRSLIAFVAPAVVVASIVAAGCSTIPPPFPVVGPPPHVSALTGSWSGEYSSWSTRRHGAISFTLASGADTAYGDVWMLSKAERTAPAAAHEANGRRPETGRSIAIAFVLVSEDSLFGLLEPYDDPVSGSTLVTGFGGRLKGDRIVGSYTTRDMRTRELTTGEWEVRRRRAD